jgi:dsRNA-specific ribonuclease
MPTENEERRRGRVLTQMDAFISGLIDRYAHTLRAPTIALLKSAPATETYRKAFTVGDYEVFEQIGDSVIGQFIVNYSYHLYPFLNNAEGVKIVARIRIKYASCAFLSDIAEDLGFWPHIRGAEEGLSVSRRQSLLEDVFEAFIGATNFLVDEAFGRGTGYIVCYSLLTAIYDESFIDISYPSLFDAKTRLKELCDFFKQRLSITWSSEKTVDGTRACLAYRVDSTWRTVQATARTKVDAEQLAAQQVIDLLAAVGIQKAPPAIFTALGARDAATAPKIADQNAREPALPAPPDTVYAAGYVWGAGAS